MSNNRYYKHYLNTILDAVGTQSAIKKFSATYNMMLQKSLTIIFLSFAAQTVFLFTGLLLFFLVRNRIKLLARGLPDLKKDMVYLLRL
jgi:hypothetical protein